MAEDDRRAALARRLPVPVPAARLRAPSGGTCTEPSASRPTFITAASTPMPGILTNLGTERGSGSAPASCSSRGGVVVIAGGM